MERGSNLEHQQIAEAALSQAFFQHFRENSTAKKPQFFPYLKKLKAIFGPKLKVGAAFI